VAWYNIVHIQPRGIVTTLGQSDVVRLLQFSLESLGHKATVTINGGPGGAVNILVGYERLPAQATLGKIKYIPYQLEQLGTGGHALSDDMRQVLSGAYAVWDYSQSNIEFLKAQGIVKTALLPLGFHEKLDTIRSENESIDVLCYGLMNARRLAVLDKLATYCVVKKLEFVYGEPRDAWIARSKIVLNIHHYLAKLGEQVRVSYLLNNGRCVVSEESAEDPLAKFCEVASYECLVETCIQLVQDRERRRKIADNGKKGFSQRSMIENLRRVLPV